MKLITHSPFFDNLLDKLLERFSEIRNALDDDAVFNDVGEVLTSAYIERVLRDYYAGNLGEDDPEDRILSLVSEDGSERSVKRARRPRQQKAQSRDAGRATSPRPREALGA